MSVSVQPHLPYLAYLLALCRSVTGLVFALSIVGKVSNMPLFQQTITTFGILPRRLSVISAWLFLGSELLVVVLVTFGATLQASLLSLGFVLASCLLLLFSFVLVSALARNIQTSCNCFGSSERLVSLYDVFRNAAFLFFSLVGFGVVSFTSGGQGDLNLAEWSFIMCGAGVFAVILMNLRDLAQVFRSD